MIRCPLGPEEASRSVRRDGLLPETMDTGSGTEVSSLTMDVWRSVGSR